MDALGGIPTRLLLDQAAAGNEESRLRRLRERAPERESLSSLQETAREFEAVFLNQLLKVMRETVPENDLFNTGGATKYYRQMHDAEIAEAMATGRSGLGVADLIVQQFASHVAARHAPAAAAAAGAGPLDLPAGERSGTTPPPVAPPPREAEPAGAPAPRPGKVPGLSAPVAVARYRSLAPVAAAVAARARLRELAAAQSNAAVDTLRRFEREIDRAAADADLDPSLVLAVIMTESGGDPSARSPQGALGLMQLMPATATEVGVTDATSPAQNLRGGADYLARMLRRYGDRLDLALAAYNAGPGNVDRAGGSVPPFEETRNYVHRVMELYGKLGGGRHDGTEIAIKRDTTAPDHP